MSRKPDGRQHHTKRNRKTFRSDSPKYDKYARYRKPDPGAEDLIRFVREHQRDRQPTAIRLQKLPPLPSIGQSHAPVVEVPHVANVFSASLNSFDESDADDELGESFPDVDGHFDSEVASCTGSFAPFEDCANQGMSDTQIHFRTFTKMKSNKGEKSKTQICSDLTHMSLSPHLFRTKPDPKTRKLPPLLTDDLLSRPCAPVPSYATESCHSSNGFILDEKDSIDYLE